MRLAGPAPAGYCDVMRAIKARVVNGKFVIDAPAHFPEGTEVDLQIADESQELDEAEQAALDAALARGWADAQAGNVRPAEELIAELRRRA